MRARACQEEAVDGHVEAEGGEGVARVVVVPQAQLHLPHQSAPTPPTLAIHMRSVQWAGFPGFRVVYLSEEILKATFHLPPLPTPPPPAASGAGYRAASAGPVATDPSFEPRANLSRRPLRESRNRAGETGRARRCAGGRRVRRASRGGHGAGWLLVSGGVGGLAGTTSAV